MAFSLGASRWRVFPHRDAAAALPGTRQRVPAAVRGVARGFRDAADPRRQFTFPVLPTEAYLQITGCSTSRAAPRCRFCCWCRPRSSYFVQRYWVERGALRHDHGKAGPQTAIRSVTAGTRGCCWCLAVAFFIAYFYALLLHASLVVAFGANHTWTLAHYHVIFTEGRKAIATR
jgi:iron(III) transport system permease protein